MTYKINNPTLTDGPTSVKKALCIIKPIRAVLLFFYNLPAAMIIKHIIRPFKILKIIKTIKLSEERLLYSGNIAH